MVDKDIQDSKLTFSVKKVKDIYFSINEQLFTPDPDKIVRIELGERIGFSLEMNLVNFILRIFFHYADATEVLVDIQVENIFEVPDLKQYATKEGIILLPPFLITSIVGISLSHGRALLIKNTIGTPWENIILPVANPENVARHFYSYMFNEEGVVYKGDKEGNKVGEKITVNKKKKTAKARN